MTTPLLELRGWIWRPKKDDNHPLTLFFYADNELKKIVRELDSFDGAREPRRCEALVEKLRENQHKLLVIIEKILAEVSDVQTSREYRLKFPDDVQEDLQGFYAPLWFGAECLAAGSVIENREAESVLLRPLAKTLVQAIHNMRSEVRAQAIRDPTCYGREVKQTLGAFDQAWTEFESQYVRCLVPVKTNEQFSQQQEVIVLFSESLNRALRVSMVGQDMIDDYEPELMFTIPRLAIIYGLLHCPEALPLEDDKIPYLFKAYSDDLKVIKDKLAQMEPEAVEVLERRLCNMSGEALFTPFSSPVQGSSSGMGGSGGVHNCNSASNSDGQPSCSSSASVKRNSRIVTTSPSSAAGRTSVSGVNERQQDSDAEHGRETHSCGIDSVEAGGMEVKVGRFSTRDCMDYDDSDNTPMDSGVKKEFNEDGDEGKNGFGLEQLDASFAKDEVDDEESKGVTKGATDGHDYGTNDDNDVASVAKALGESSLADTACAEEPERVESELVKSMFMRVSKVADNLQSDEHTKDFRHILKTVFIMYEMSPIATMSESMHTPSKLPDPLGSRSLDGTSSQDDVRAGTNTNTSFSDNNPSSTEPTAASVSEPASTRSSRNGPVWVPDHERPQCCSCRAPFTFTRRRHHCRNCGEVFCGRCCSQYCPVPKWGMDRPVRVCTRCYVFEMDSFF
eukprot:Nk52_evm33s2402 gene=Nk52_evmTU33s2402